MSKRGTARLGSLTNVRTGKRDAGESAADGAYPLFTCSREPLRIGSYSYDCECVLVAGNGDLHVRYYNGKFDAYQRTYIVEAKEKSALHVPYLYHFLSQYVDRLRAQSVGGVIKYIKLGHLTEAEIPLPSIEEQRRIADVLGEAAELIALRSRQSEEWENLARAAFYEMFGDPAFNEQGWETAALGDVIVGTAQNGFFAKAGEYGSDGDAEVIWVNDVIDKRACEVEQLRRVNARPQDIEKFGVAFGDLLFCRSSLTKAGIGKCAYVPQEVRPRTLFDCHIIRARVDLRRAHPIFLQAQTMTEFFRSQLLRHAKTSTMTTIKREGIVTNTIILPPLELQQRFADTIAEIEVQKRLVHRALEETRRLYDSLASRFFAAVAESNR